MSKPICPELLGKRLWGVFNSELRPVKYVKCGGPIVSLKMSPEQQEKFNVGKKIIEEASGKKLMSLNQKNNPTKESVKDSWDDL